MVDLLFITTFSPQTEVKKSGQAYTSGAEADDGVDADDDDDDDDDDNYDDDYDDRLSEYSDESITHLHNRKWHKAKRLRARR